MLKANMKIVVATVCVLLAGGFEALACRNDWMRFGDSCYAFVDEKVTWSTAMEICRTLKANLVEINNDAENAFLASTMNSRHFTSIWTGMQDFLREGTFVYSSNLQHIGYSHWRPGQPNNNQAAEQGQDCVVLTFTSEWDDYWCDNTHMNEVVCEYFLEEDVIG